MRNGRLSSISCALMVAVSALGQEQPKKLIPRMNLSRQYTGQIPGTAVSELEPGEANSMVFALSYSEDGRYLAIGLRYFTKEGFVTRLSAAVVKADDPAVQVSRFDLPLLPTKRSRFLWSSSGNLLAVNPISPGPGALIDLSASEEPVHFISNRLGANRCGGIASFLPVGQAMIACREKGSPDFTVTFQDLSGKGRDSNWSIVGGCELYAVTAGGERMAIGCPDNPAKPRGAHHVAILDTEQRKEISRWPLRYPADIRMAFASNGSTVCTVSDAITFISLYAYHELECRDVESSRRISHQVMMPGPIFRFEAVGQFLYVEYFNPVTTRAEIDASRKLQDPSLIDLAKTGSLVDIATGESRLEWPVGARSLMPSIHIFDQSTVSRDGTHVAMAGGGKLSIYTIEQ